MLMAYIIFVNPQMMAASGMDIGASFVGTCIAASTCIAMGVYIQIGLVVQHPAWV